MNKLINPSTISLFIMVLIMTCAIACSREDAGHYAHGKGWITPISVIQKSPLNFRNKDVLIDCQVVDIENQDRRLYKVKDLNGEFFAVLKQHYPNGSFIVVKGKVETILGTGRMAVVEE